MKYLIPALLLPLFIGLQTPQPTSTDPETPKVARLARPHTAEAPAPKEAMKLGERAVITATAHCVKASTLFWKRLGFRQVAEGSEPMPWVQLTDESLLLHIVQEDSGKFVRLAYFTDNYEDKLKGLKKAKVKPVQPTDSAGTALRAVWLTPDSLSVSIENQSPDGMYEPQGKTMLTMEQEDMMSPSMMPTKLGMFGEYCHKVTNLKEAMAYWEKLGFKSKTVNLMPYPWAIMTDGMTIIGLHQTKDWSGSAITYFAPDMGKRLEGLKKEGIVWKEIGMGPNNVVVTTPEGMQLFLFSMM
jgi:hypothetical protein